jgi:hypothetical protein
MQNNFQELREMINIGSAMKCNKQVVDAEKYY